MEDHPRKPLSAGHLIAGYAIIREIGRGGFGIVYEAVNPVTNQQVAIKQFYPQTIASWRQGTIVIDKDDDKLLVAKILQRFEEEARLQSKFDHPNILKVRNFVRADNTGYMITDYIDGTTLVKHIEQYGNVCPSEDMFRHTMEPIAKAVEYVHEHLALHRDIAPDNIMIDRSGKPTLVDFGAAKRDLRRNPSPHSIYPYKEAYAPVEQQEPAAESPEGYFTDIYALAGTMYYLLSGRPPMRSMARLAAGSKDPYVPIAQVAKVECSGAVYHAIDRGLALAPADRPQTIDNFLQLLGWRQGETPFEPPPRRSTEESTVTVELPEEPPAESNWKAYAFVVLLVAAVAGGLFLSQSNDQAPPIISTPAPVPTPAPVATPVFSRPTPAPAPAPAPAPPEPQVREASLYQTALDCMRGASSSSCNIDYCLTPYRTNVGFGERYPALRTEYFRLTQRCTTPTPTPTPTPVPAPSYRTYENRDIDKGDLPGPLPHLRDTDQAACESACNNNLECVGYAYGKWDKACYLKGSLPDLRFEPNSTAVIRTNQRRPPDFVASKKIESARRAFSGNRYSMSSTGSRQMCSELCVREEACLGYQYVGSACWRYDRIDFATRDDTAQAGVKRQLPP